ncbi:glycosyltransferase family 2 protein [Jatrophihabitans sp. YIM 134969]
MTATRPRHGTVSVVIPTRDRHVLMRRAIQAVVAQDHPGPIEVIAVFDHAPVDESVVALSTPDRVVRCVPNTHVPGLAGARNSGVAAAEGDVIAFCDDDDEWHPDKLRRQLVHLTTTTPLVSCGVEIVYRGERFTRFPPTALTTHRDFLRHRVPSVHSSTLLADGDLLRGMAGPLDEAIPGSYGEDWDFLLRATASRPVFSVSAALVTVHWHETSYFIDNWTTAADGLDYIVDKHRDFATDRRARGRVTGQRAFYHAAAGHRGRAAVMAVDGLRSAPTGKHAWAALLVSAGVVSPDRVLGAAHTIGRGI